VSSSLQLRDNAPEFAPGSVVINSPEEETNKNFLAFNYKSIHLEASQI
jgi:hypothetical protein